MRYRIRQKRASAVLLNGQTGEKERLVREMEGYSRHFIIANTNREYNRTVSYSAQVNLCWI